MFELSIAVNLSLAGALYFVSNETENCSVGASLKLAESVIASVGAKSMVESNNGLIVTPPQEIVPSYCAFCMLHSLISSVTASVEP